MEGELVQDRDIILVFGKTGMGKTQWTKRYLRTISRAIILDPLDEYADCGPRFDDLGDLIEHVQRHRLFRVRTAWVEEFPVLCAVASGAGDCLLAIEEAQRVVPPGFPVPSGFENLVYRGRHRGVSLLCVSQRPTTLNIVARSQWTRIISFAQSEAADVRWLRSVTGFDLEPERLDRLCYYDIAPHGMTSQKLDLSVPILVHSARMQDE